MTAALPLSPRLLALIGAGLAVVLVLLVARPLLLSGDGTQSAAPVSVTPRSTTPSVPSTPSKPVAPKVVLLPGLPRPIAAKLRQSRVVVVALYTRTAPTDFSAVRDAKQGAHAAGAGFTAIDLLDEDAARAVNPFVGTVDTPSVLVVRRPGTIVSELEGRVDSAIVEQAAHNAGARR